MGALATGNITNFVSGMGLAGGAGSAGGYGLSFANTSNISGTGYGGNFGANDVPCMYDAYGNMPTGLASPPGGSPITAITTSDSYRTTTDYVLGNGTPIVVGQDGSGQGISYTVYVRGNLYIQSNVTYNYGSIREIPRVNFYVQGNIYIDNDVTELHGVYVAQKQGASGGSIVTCTTTSAVAVQPFANCNRQLKVVGAMEAQGDIRMNRTYGSLIGTAGVSADPAEVFQYSPELWLAQPADGRFEYQSYTSLPPVL
jgi:hypothetical protein